jgi:hypothetical protein
MSNTTIEVTLDSPNGPKVVALNASQNIQTVDNMMDATAELTTNPRARSRAMAKAYIAGLQPCEVCGRGIKPGAKAVTITVADDCLTLTVGTDCAKRLTAAGYTWA